MPGRFFPLLFAAVALSGCGGQRVPPVSRHLPASVATPPSDASLLRIPRGAGTAELLRANTLAQREWVITGGLPTLSRLLGTSAEERTVYAADATGHLIAIDLAVRRSRTIPTGTRQFMATPDGTILGVDSAHHAVRLAGRALVTYPAPVERGAVLLRGPGDQVIVVGNRPGALQVYAPNGEVRHLTVPNGRVAATWIGDLVAIVTDSGVTFADPTGRVEKGRKASPVRSVKIRGTPVAATFSPSGHRLYVARKKGGLVMIDRFTREPLRELLLPGVADGLRVDRSGRWLLAHSSTDDALWLVDLSRWVVASTRTAPWSDDLPQVVDGHILLARNKADLSAVDLDTDTSREQGTLVGGGADLYIMLPWVLQKSAGAEATTVASAAPPAAPVTVPPNEPAGTVAAPPPPPPAATQEAADAAPATAKNLYLQVSSSQNQDWAKAFAQQLKDGGFPAKVLNPTSSDEGYRVVIGPYTTREEADAVGKRLGRSYFIITPASGDT